MDWQVIMLTLHLLIFKIITVMGKIIKFLLICLGFKSLTACDVEIWNGTAEYDFCLSVLALNR